VHQAVHHRVGHRRVRHEFVPLVHKCLARHHGRPGLAPVLQYLKQFPAFWRSKRAESPVVQRQKVRLGQFPLLLSLLPQPHWCPATVCCASCSVGCIWTCASAHLLECAEEPV
jgi:hypothetical protein